MDAKRRSTFEYIEFVRTQKFLWFNIDCICVYGSFEFITISSEIISFP